MVQDRFSEEDTTNPPNSGTNDSFNEPTFIPSSVFSSFYNEILEEHSLNQDGEGNQPELVNDGFQDYTNNDSNYTSNDFGNLGDFCFKNPEETLPTSNGQNHNQQFKSTATDEPLINFNISPPSHFNNHLSNEKNYDNTTENKFDFNESFTHPEFPNQPQFNNLFSSASSIKNLSSDFLIQFCQLEPKGTCQKFTITKFYQHSVYKPWFCESHSAFYQSSEKDSSSETPIFTNKAENPPIPNSKSQVFASNAEEQPIQISKAEEDLPSTSISSDHASATPSPPSSLKPKESDSVSLFSMGNTSNSKWSTISAQFSNISAKSRAKKPSKVSAKSNLPKKIEYSKDDNIQIAKTPAELNSELVALSGIRLSVPKDILNDKISGRIYIYSVKTPIDAKTPIKQYYKIGSQMNIKNVYLDELCKCPIVNGIRGQGTIVQLTFLGNLLPLKHLKLCIYLLHEEVKKNMFAPAPLKNDNCLYCGGSHDEWFYLNEDCISHLERNHKCPRDTPNFGWTYVNSALRRIKSITDLM